jgi:phosphoenolpyruvate carboxykinase (ATP)
MHRMAIRELPYSAPVYRELTSAELAKVAVESGQCSVTAHGALVLRTGKFTGRSPGDRFITRDEMTDSRVDWNSTNVAISRENFAALEAHVRDRLRQQGAYELHLHAGGPAGSAVRLLTTSAAHALFCRHLLQSPSSSDDPNEALTILHTPDCAAIPKRHGTKSGTFIVLNPASRCILIGGTGYAGEIKKAVFSHLNFLLPERGILPMHAAVNVGARGDSALFFGLSGTGKTTLSADPERFLLGDDEHAWSDDGLFNLEGGCYAKTINLSERDEPQIWGAVHSPLTVLENVVMDEATGLVDFADASLTENTRAAYSLSGLPRVWPAPVVAAPGHVIFLTADAFGVLPPLARLSLDQAVYYFLSGYTAKVAGTERGLKEPSPTFSTCFGAPFMPRRPTEYARLLRNRVAQTGSRVWLVNTGWSGGAYGVGQRMPIAETRRMVAAILAGELDDAPTRRDPWFGLEVPLNVNGVRPEVLDARGSWAKTQEPASYDQAASALARRFVENFARYADDVSAEVRRAAPEPH